MMLGCTVRKRNILQYPQSCLFCHCLFLLLLYVLSVFFPLCLLYYFIFIVMCFDLGGSVPFWATQVTFGFVSSVVFVRLAVLPLYGWHSKILNVGHFVKTFQPNSFMCTMLLATIDCYHFMPHSVTLAFTRGHKVSTKQNLLALLSCTLSKWIGWSNSSWTSWGYFWLRFII